MNKIIYKTIGLALFVTCITSLSVPVTSVFIHGKADSPSETVSKTFEKSNLEEITEISFNKDSIVWSKKANNKKSVSSIDLEYNFYMFDSGNTYYYAADLSDDTSELINFSLESNRNGDILNVAFYNRQEKKYTYYYNIADVSLADRIKQKAVPLSYADENLKTTICSSVNWFFDLNGETEVTQTEDRKTYSPETLRATLETYLADRSARRQRIETEKKTGKEKRFFGNAENSQEKTEIYSVSAQSEDDDIVFFIPREYFTSAGRRVGSVSGTMSYYINTVEWPSNSNRFLSEILLWSNFIETYPNYERDLFSFKVTPELSATFDYALNGFSPTGTMSDVVRDLNIATDLALKNIEIEVEIDPINSYYLNGTFYDYDEYFYSMLSESFGQKKGNSASVTGIFSTVAGVASLVALPFSSVPGVVGALSTVLGVLSTALAVTDSVVTMQNGSHTSVIIGSESVYVNFVALRESHYKANGNKFIRNIHSVASPDCYFAPADHPDFNDGEERYFRLTGALNAEGSDGIYKTLKIKNTVDIVSMRFGWPSGNVDYDEHQAEKEINQTYNYYR